MRNWRNTSEMVRMNKKRKCIAYAVIIIVSVILLALFIPILGRNEKYDFIPYVLGSCTVFAIYGVKHSGQKPVEWNSEDK